MKRFLQVSRCALILGSLAALGCKKNEGAVGTTPQNAAPAPAAVATATTASQAPPAPSGASVDTTSKLAAAEWAIRQDAIKNDPDGQWAVSVTASSSYQDAQGTADWSANQATGVPNVETFGDNGKAWAPKSENAGIEWLDLKFPKPVHATEIRVRESCGSGAVIKLEVFDEQGAAHTAWAGNDPTTGLNYLIVKLARTEYKTDHVKVTLATNVVPGWNEIDAVQLVGKDQ